ncbi:MAG: hypothetical protein KA383_04905 [Phycisphaerae bacterium]|nr:hypothetical protein [Phycisphaerae bacterium]
MAESEYKHCLRCGYILDHLPAPRCPECGLEFDPNQPETYRCPQPRQSARPYFIVACTGGLMLLAAYFVTRISEYSWAWVPDWVAWTLYLVPVVGWVLLWWIFLRGVYLLFQRQRFRRFGLFIVALVISAIGGPGTCLLTALGGP